MTALAVSMKGSLPPVSSAEHMDPDSVLNKLTMQIFGKCIYQRAAFASDACELSVGYSYSMRYSDFREHQEKTKTFLRSAQEKCNINIRILGPTLEDFKKFHKEKKIELKVLCVEKVYKAFDKIKTIGYNTISDLDNYLDAKINSELNKHLPEDSPHLFFAWEAGSYRLEDNNSKSFDKIMNEDLFERLAECVEKASQELKDFFNKDNKEFCEKLESLGITDKEASSEKLKEKSSQSSSPAAPRRIYPAAHPPQIVNVAVQNSMLGKRSSEGLQYVPSSLPPESITAAFGNAYPPLLPALAAAASASPLFGVLASSGASPRPPAPAAPGAAVASASSPFVASIFGLSSLAPSIASHAKPAAEAASDLSEISASAPSPSFSPGPATGSGYALQGSLGATISSQAEVPKDVSEPEEAQDVRKSMKKPAAGKIARKK